MLRDVFKAYAIVAVTFFLGHLIYEVVAEIVVKPLLLNTFFPHTALHRAPTSVVEETFRTIARILRSGASWFALHLNRFLHTLIHSLQTGGHVFVKTLKQLGNSTYVKLDMGGWFSRNEVINNGTSSVVFHMETLKTTLLLVSGGILVISLGCVTARWCWMSRKNSARASEDAERGIAIELEKSSAAHEKELTNIRNSINLQNAQMGSAAGALASARAPQQLPNTEAKHMIFPQF